MPLELELNETQDEFSYRIRIKDYGKTLNVLGEKILSSQQ